MMDDKLDEQLKDLASEYNRPPKTPREEMWTAIQKTRVSYRSPKRMTWKPLAWGGRAAAAVLAIGIFIGNRMNGNSGESIATNGGNQPRIDTTGPDRAFKIAAVQYLGETEEFLAALVRANRAISSIHWA